MKKKLSAVVLTMTMVASLTACGSAAKESTPSQTTVAQTTEAAKPSESAKAQETAAAEESNYEGKTVTVWISSGAEDDVYREMFDAIETELNITITDEYYSKDELDNKMQTAPIAGDMPDAVVADYLLIPKYYEAGLVAELNDYVSDELLNDYLPSVIEECTVDGKMISVAQFDSGLALWANKEMLETAGVRIPESYTEAWDKAEFEDALQKLKDSGVEWPLYVRQNKPSTEYYTWMPFVASFGGDYMNRETGLCTGTLDGEETIAAFDYLSWLFEQGYCDATCDYEDSFQKGENALVLYGHSNYRKYESVLGDNLILIPLPDMGNGVYTCSGSTVMIMTTGAQASGNDDATWAMLERATSPEYIEMVVNTNGAVPARLSVKSSLSDYQEGGRLYLYGAQLEAGMSFLRPYTSAHMTIYDAMASVIGNIYAGADPATELKAAAESIDEIIVENGWGF